MTNGGKVRTSGFQRLREDVIDPGLCTRCGGCVAACPVECISHVSTGIVLSGECIGCGICRSICPGASMDISAHERRLFGRAHGRTEPGGVSVGRHSLVASDKEVFRRGYFGGRVSAMLISLISSGRIDAALLTDFSRVDGTLSVGSARIARSREEVLSLAGSKYLFSPVLSLLREVEEDPSIRSVAIVCLPCHAHAIRNMETEPRTSHLTRKVNLIIGLNCGAVNLDEEKWKRVIGGISGIGPRSVASVDIRKASSKSVKVTARGEDGEVVERIVGFSRYSTSVLREGIWPRCRACIDYPCFLSDITFGSPIVRTRRGAEALDAAIVSGSFRRSSFRRRAWQSALDVVWGTWKAFRARRAISKARRRGRPIPEYR